MFFNLPKNDGHQGNVQATARAKAEGKAPPGDSGGDGFAFDGSVFGGLIMAVIMLVVVLLFYILPTIIAVSRGHQNVASIAVVNILLGWTFLGGSRPLFGHSARSEVGTIITITDRTTVYGINTVESVIPIGSTHPRRAKPLGARTRRPLRRRGCTEVLFSASLSSQPSKPPMNDEIPIHNDVPKTAAPASPEPAMRH